MWPQMLLNYALWEQYRDHEQENWERNNHPLDVLVSMVMKREM